MDAALLNMIRSGRNRNWAETMVNLEARKLINTANTLSSFHLKDGLTRLKFVQEIKYFIELQFAAARRAKSDAECMFCIKNLRAENENLQLQDKILRIKTAKIYAKVEFVRENNKIMGYVISAVQVIISGFAIVFRWLPMDYYREIDTISRPKLTMKIIGYGVKAKVIFDLLDVDSSNTSF